ncbi:hypothetical protein DY000_02028990 [Brassica cretica]|uniref:Uncharacterized protein n=1 Tax=Brassica cretica TaxID=69181 RepID=A0ABQ7DY21_BRACR|nr:hypothetical protein DY000_02028990 [Brassica cretica]
MGKKLLLLIVIILSVLPLLKSICCDLSQIPFTKLVSWLTLYSAEKFEWNVVNDLPEEKDPVVGEADKKKVVRKGLFKSNVVAGASTKAQMVQALMATRKHTVTKPATRQGKGAKQQEERDLASMRSYRGLQDVSILHQLTRLVPLNQTQRSQECLEMVALAGYGCTNTVVGLIILNTEKAWQGKE